MYEDNITASQYMDLNDDEKTHVTLQTDGTYLYNVQGTIEGHLSRFGGGIALGYQWLIGDSFTLDWTFIGIGVEKWNMGLEVSASSENYDPDYQQWADDIKEGAEDFFFIGDKIDVQVEKRTCKSRTPGCCAVSIYVNKYWLLFLKHFIKTREKGVFFRHPFCFLYPSGM